MMEDLAAFTSFCADFAKKGRYCGEGNFFKAIAIDNREAENEIIAFFYVLFSDSHARIRE